MPASVGSSLKPLILRRSFVLAPSAAQWRHFLSDRSDARGLLLACLLTLLSVGPGLRAQPKRVPPGELTLPVLKAYVDKALADPKRADDLKERHYT